MSAGRQSNPPPSCEGEAFAAQAPGAPRIRPTELPFEPLPPRDGDPPAKRSKRAHHDSDRNINVQSSSANRSVDQTYNSGSSQVSRNHTSTNYSGKSRRYQSGDSLPQVEQTEVFHSITCMPEMRHHSFEELRVECYKSAISATGKPPQPVAEDTPPSERLPPPYVPFVSQPLSHGQLALGLSIAGTQRPDSQDTIMSNKPELSSPFTFTPAGDERN